MPSLCSSLPMVRPGVPRSIEEGGELFFARFGAIGNGALREDGEEVGEPGVRDPHLFAVERVGLPVVGEHGPRACAQRVGAAGGLRKRVGADELAAGQLGQVLLLLLRRAVPDDRQRPDADVRGEDDGEAALLGDVVGDDGGGDLVHLQAAVLLGNVDGGKAKLGGLLEEAASDGKVLGLDLIGDGNDLVGGKLGRGLGDLALLFGEVFREEAVLRRGVGDEEGAAGKNSLVGGVRRDGRCGHHQAPSTGQQLYSLKDSGGAHASAYTHCYHAVPRFAARHLAQQRGRELGSGAAQRMAERDGSAVDVDFRRVDSKHLDDGERLSGKGFVQFDDVDLFQRQPRHLQRLRNGVDRADAHLLGIAARIGKGDEPCHRLDARARRHGWPT